jgi:mono/diheme cytochrome c family protein
MRGRNWQAMAVAGLTAFTLACGGDQPAQDTSESMAEEAPAQQMGEGMAEEMPTEQMGGGMDQEMPAEQMGGGMAGELPEGVTAEMAAQGRQLFAGSGGCQACHNPQATGTQLAPDLTDDTWINVSGRNYDEIVSLIKTGVPQPHEHPAPMPPMGGANLTDEQVDALAAYIVSLGS